MTRSKRQHLTIGTRGSQLALIQANAVAEEMRRRVPHVEIGICEIRTKGDRDQRTPLQEFQGTGLFVKEIEKALLVRTIDVAVHSMKDVPTEMDERLTIGAVPPREDARDVLISRAGLTLAELGEGAIVGTSSLRRQAQLLRQRPDLQIKELRGNLDTRLRKLDEGQYDAIMVAMAGLARMGLSARATQILDIETFVPAVGQGALAIQVRKDDARTQEVVHALNCTASEMAVRAERAFLARLGGGCQIPIGAHGTIKDGALTLVGCVCHPRGERHFQDRLSGSVSGAESLGGQLAERLLEEGASSLLDEIL